MKVVKVKDITNGILVHDSELHDVLGYVGLAHLADTYHALIVELDASGADYSRVWGVENFVPHNEDWAELIWEQ
jgi:hypothetical protein